jgi:hypothetical protein
LIYNTLTFQRVGGTAYSISDSTSVSLYRKNLTFRKTDLICETDTQVQNIADFFMRRYKMAEYRIGSMQVQGADRPATAWPLILGLNLRDRTTGNVLAPGGTSISASLFVDGISHSITAAKWETTFSFSSASAYPSTAVLGLWDTALWDTGVWYV